MNVDLFSGPRGWSEGLGMLGIADVGFERDTAACRTAVAAGHATVQCDVAQYPTAPFLGRIKGFIASPPCQAWSRAGKRKGLEDQPLVHQAVHDLAHGRDTRAELLAQCKDERSLLAAEPMRWLADLRPEWVCMEEVVDVLPLWKQYALYLQQWGYSTWTGVLNAADYGVPQTRQRAILIASRARKVTAPDPTHAKKPEWDLFGECLKPWVSMAEALGWGATDRPVPTVTAGGGKTGGAEPFPTQARQALLAAQQRGAWILHTNRDQRADGTRQTTDPHGAPAPTLTSKSGGQWVLKSRRDSDTWVAKEGPRENRRGNQPAPTFTGEAHRWAWERQQPTTEPDTVRITVAEAAVLQSFRPDYPFWGTKTKQFEQVGNAVPPLLAAHVASAATGIPVRQAEAVAA